MPLCFAFGCNPMTGCKQTCCVLPFPTDPKKVQMDTKMSVNIYYVHTDPEYPEGNITFF